MKTDPLAEADRWLRQAQKDLEDARFNQNGGRHHLACFIAQQSAEKALKAFLYAQGLEEVRGHSMADLCKAAMEYDIELNQLKQDAASLSQYYIPTRYPNGLNGGIPTESYDINDSNLALGRAERIVSRIAQKIEQLKVEAATEAEEENTTSENP